MTVFATTEEQREQVLERLDDAVWDDVDWEALQPGNLLLCWRAYGGKRLYEVRNETAEGFLLAPRAVWDGRSLTETREFSHVELLLGRDSWLRVSPDDAAIVAAYARTRNRKPADQGRGEFPEPEVQP